MLPNNQWSSMPVIADLLYPRDTKESLLSSKDYGPIAVQNTTQGLKAKVWSVSYDSASGAVRLQDGSLLFVEKNIKELDLTFNQTANPFVAYRVGSNIKIFWYDTTTSTYVNKTIGLGDQPFCYLDERRPEFSAKSDVILIYHRNGSVYYRLQRDRFDIERPTGITGKTNLVIENFGMAKNNRLLIKFYETGV